HTAPLAVDTAAVHDVGHDLVVVRTALAGRAQDDRRAHAVRPALDIARRRHGAERRVGAAAGIVLRAQLRAGAKIHWHVRRLAQQADGRDGHADAEPRRVVVGAHARRPGADGRLRVRGALPARCRRGQVAVRVALAVPGARPAAGAVGVRLAGRLALRA